MNNLDLLVEAINKKQSISFQYNKTGKVQGERIGHPYAVFIFTAKSGVQTTKVHIVQVSGVSDSKDKSPFPDFRMFNIEDLSDVEILESKFEGSNPKYNPEWEGYRDVLAKI